MADADYEILDERFAACVKPERAGRAPVRRLPLGRGAGLRSRRAATSSGATSRTTACCAGTRRPARRRLPRSRRATRTATRSTAQGRLVTLRARRPARHAHRARRLDHRDRRPLRGQAAQQPERRRRQLGRRDLVHRPGYGIDERLRGPPGRERDRRLPRVPGRRRSGGSPRSSPTTSSARTGSPSRPTSSSSTCPTPGVEPGRTSACFDVGERRDAVRRRGLRDLHGRRVRRLSPRRRRAASGRAPATASTAYDAGRHADRQGPRPRDRRRTSCFGGPKRNRLFICATTSLYSVLLPVLGAPTIGP